MLVCNTAYANFPGKHGGDASTKAYEHAMEKMHHRMDITYTGDADLDFVTGMVPHHQGAVDMANIELRYGQDPTMRALAQRIITWQEYEIGTMNAWLYGHTSHYRASDADQEHSVIGYKEAMERMHHGMMVPYTGNADIDFARGMIPHHQGAIDMAWILKRDGKSLDLRTFADDIIRSQGQEIRLMQRWLDSQETKK